MTKPKIYLRCFEGKEICLVTLLLAENTQLLKNKPQNSPTFVLLLKGSVHRHIPVPDRTCQAKTKKNTVFKEKNCGFFISRSLKTRTLAKTQFLIQKKKKTGHRKI